tara:strand:- start:1262 stop:3454 length:2193 start_codon:yes stop_codon:yes gene_type:complete
MTTYSELVKNFRAKNSKPKTGWRYESWSNPDVERIGMKPGGLVEPGVTHYSKYTDTEAAQKYGDFLKGKKWSELTDKVKGQIKSLYVWRKKNPEGTTKFKTLTIGGKEFNLPATRFKGGDDSQWRAAIKFLENWKQNPTVENYVTLLNKEDKTTQSLLKRIRNYYTGGKSHPGKDNIIGKDTKKILDSLKVDKTILNADELKEFKRYTRKVTQPVRAVIQATPGSAKKALYKSAENVIKINNIFKANPSITLHALTRKIHGKDFARAGDAGKLDMATKVSDDVAKYLEAISKTTEGEVARVIPRGLKTQWSPPTGKNLKNIMEYIRSQSKGFRFREGTLRNYKYSIRDSLMKLPPGTTRNLENKLKGVKGVLDHAVGLSATFDVAPGYTEAFQMLEKSVNHAKGIGVDREFGPALRAALEGDFSKVDAYNKTAAKFQKNNPGVDVPFIEKGGDPRKTVKYFDQFSPAAQKNILEVAKKGKGVAIKTEALPLTEKQIAKILNKSFRCGQADGISCDDPRAYMKALEETKIKAAKGDKAAFGKFRKVANAMRKLKGAAAFTGWGILGEIGFALPFAAMDYADGQSTARIINNASFGLFGMNEEEETISYLPEGSKGAEQIALEKAYTTHSALTDPDRNFPKGRIGMDPKRLQTAQQDVTKGAYLDLIKKATPFMQGPRNEYLNEEALVKAYGEVEAAKIQMADDIAKRKEERTVDTVFDYYDNYLPGIDDDK